MHRETPLLLGADPSTHGLGPLHRLSAPHPPGREGDGFSRVLVRDKRLRSREGDSAVYPLLGGVPGKTDLGPGRLVQQLLAMEARDAHA